MKAERITRAHSRAQSTSTTALKHVATPATARNTALAQLAHTAGQSPRTAQLQKIQQLANQHLGAALVLQRNSDRLA